MDRGANYISVSDEDGNVSKKWLHEVRQIAERNTVTIITIMMNSYIRDTSGILETITR